MAFVDNLRGNGEQITDAVSQILSNVVSSRRETHRVSHAHSMLTCNLEWWTLTPSRSSSALFNVRPVTPSRRPRGTTRSIPMPFLVTGTGERPLHYPP